MTSPPINRRRNEEVNMGSMQTSTNALLLLETWDALSCTNGQKCRKNYPPQRTQAHFSLYRRALGDEPWKVLMAGGIRHSTILNDTWIYTPWSNSWFQVSTGLQLSPTFAGGHPIQPTLCDIFVILINGVTDVWLFDGRTETWRQLSTQRYSNNIEEYGVATIAGAVGVQHSMCTSSPCHCSGSVFIYGYSARYPFSIQISELRCHSNQDGWLDCYWERDPHYVSLVRSSNLNCDANFIYAHYPHGLMAAADNDRGIIYFVMKCLADEFQITKTIIVFKYDSKTRDVQQLTFRVDHGVCFYNVFVWETQLMLVDYTHTFAMSLSNNSRHQLLPMYSSNPCLCEDTYLGTPSFGPFRFQWDTIHFKPHIYTYESATTCANCFPQFVETKKPFPSLEPGSLNYHTSVYSYESQTLYVYGGIKNGQLINSSAGNMWTFSMASRAWWLITPHIVPSAHVHNCGTYSGSTVVLFGGLYGKGTVSNELWVYNPNLRQWNRINFYSASWPDARAGCSLTSSIGSTMILFGGYTDGGRSKSDVWLLNLATNGTEVWENVTPNAKGSSTPSPRFGHSTVIVGDELVVYGGISNSSDDTTALCLSDMWAFRVSNRTWRQLITPNHDLLRYQPRMFAPIETPCTSFPLPYGYSKIVFWESVSREEQGVSNTVWMIDLESMTRTDHVFDLPSPNGSIIVQAAGIWNSSLVYYAQNTTGERLHGVLLAIGEKCRPGFAPIQGPSEPCKHCPAGQYSQTHLTVNQCAKCPRGTSTTHTVENATSVKNCTCDVTYCAHGNCEIRGSGNEISGICRCSFAFNGNQCDHVDYAVFILSFGLLTFVAIVITILAWCGIKTARHRRARKQTEWELRQTSRAFTVLPWEIELESRLDEDCPGGYGQVHKAKYRDWTVAVKQLQLVMAEWPDIRREFLREIQFMRTVRHPNIVMFIGAGQHDENHLFLILEFMSGGALRSLLENDAVELTRQDQLQFIVDAAEGMNYLHTLEPPRIHRDLKSANLLLSSTRRVKVADFGSARLIPHLNKGVKNESPNYVGNQKGIESHQLLNEETQLTSRYIGTARWRSPELWLRKVYGTATDVYRYYWIKEQLKRQSLLVDACDPP